MSLWQTPEGAARVYDRLNSLPAALPEDFGPGIMGGFGEGVVRAPFAIPARAALAITETAIPAARMAVPKLPDLFQKPVDDWLAAEQAANRRDALAFNPKPERVGLVGQVAFSVLTMLPELVGATVATGSPLGGFAYETWVHGTMRKVQLEAQGVAPEHAAALGYGEGAVSGAAAFLPAAFAAVAPLSLAPRIAAQVGSQAGLNVAIGVGQRAASAQYLDSKGYTALAQQIHPFAVAEVAVDAIIGGAFGLLALPRGAIPAERLGPTADAAMTVNSAGHAEMDLAPGVALDIPTMNKQPDALAESTMALLGGRPPDVEGIVEGAEFAPRPPDVQRALDLAAKEGDVVRAEIQAEATTARAADLEVQEAPAPKIPDLAIAAERLTPDAFATLRAMYEAAAWRKPAFDEKITAIAKAVGGAVQLAGLKSPSRASEKIAADYGMNPVRLTDLLRATIIVDTPEAALVALDRVLGTYQRAGKVINRFEQTGTDGYRDVIAKVDVAGHVSEIQIHVKEIQEAKQAMHALYLERENIVRNAATAQRAMTKAERKRFDKLNETMRAGYEEAFTIARKRASSMATPLRMVESSEKGSGLPSDQVRTSPLEIDTGSPSTSQNVTPGSNIGRTAAVIEITSKLSIPPSGETLKFALYGKADTVKVGEQYQPVKWAVVDAAALTPAMGKGEAQARDRTRAASQTQIAKIAASLDFKLLGESPLMDFGAPTLGPDGAIIGGNARVAAIRRAYELPGGADAYAAALRAAAPDFGLVPGRIEGIARPVLVRVLQGDVDVRAMALASNEGAGMRMSLLEQAAVDAERLPPLDAFFVPEDGNLNALANRDTVMAWVGHYPGTEQAALVDAGGALSQEGMIRLRNAVLVKAYGDSPTLQRLVELADPGAKNVGNALTKAGPVVASARDAIARGDLHPVDPLPHLLAAVEKFGQLKGEGTKVADFQAQGELMGPSLTPEASAILGFMDSHARSARAIADMVAGMYRSLEAAGSPKTADFYGGGVPDVRQLVEAGIREGSEPGALTGSLFDRPDSFPGDAAAPRSKASANYEADTRIEQSEFDGLLHQTAVDCDQRAAA